MISSMKVRLAVAGVAMAMLVVFAGFHADTTRAQSIQPSKQRWSDQNAGFISLGKVVGKQYQQGRITLEQARDVLGKVRGIPDPSLRALALQYKRDRDYVALRRGLADAEADTVRAQDDPFEIECDCTCESELVWIGCDLGGGQTSHCNWLADAQWCACIGGTFLPNGLCY